MSRKTSTSVRLEPDVNRARKRSDESFGANVNGWARQYYIEGMDPLPAEAVDELIEDERENIRRLEEAIEAAEARVKRLEELKGPTPAGEAECTLEEAAEAIAGVPAGARGPENEAVQLWAKRAGVTPEELLEEAPAFRANRVSPSSVASSD